MNADRPYQTIVLGLVFVGVMATLLHLLLHRISARSPTSSGVIERYELLEISRGNVYREIIHRLDLREHVVPMTLIVAALSLRLFMLPFLLQYTQCTVPGLEVCRPLHY